MGRSMVASLILRLRDLVSPGLGALQRRLQGVRAAAERIGAIGAVVGAISLAVPIQQAAAFDQRLRDIAVTAGRVGPEVGGTIQRLTREFEALALVTGQRSTGVAEAAGVLIAAGMEQGLIDRLMPTIARVATATNASITDIATTAFTLSDTLRVAPEQMEAALAAMVTAGKEGRFELRAMAREFPQLTASVAGLGLRGREAVNSIAALLQAARRGAGSESEAANNLSNFLNKLTSPETVRNFREAGVDLERLMADAARRGINPIEAVIQKVREISGGNMFRVGELFGDTQVLNFLRPMLENTAEYIRIRDLAARSTPDIIGTDFQSQMEGLNRQMEIFNEHLSQLGTRAGRAFGELLAVANPALAELRRGIAYLDERFPGLVDTTFTVAGAAAAAAAALGALGFVMPAVAAGVRLLLSPFAAIWSVMKAIGIGAAAIFGVKGAIVLAVVAAVAAIFLGWDRVQPYFEALWNAVKGIFDGFGTWLSQWVEGEGQIAWLAGVIVSAWRPLGEFFSGLFDGISTAAQRLMGWLRPVLDAAAWIAGTRSGEGTLTDPAQQAERRQRGGSAGRAAAAGAMWGPLPAQQPVRGEIVVRAAPGAEIERVESGNRDIGLTIAPSRGLMLGVP